MNRIKNIGVTLAFILFGNMLYAQEIGANFNENIDEPILRINELKNSGVTWVRGFVNITDKYLKKTNNVVTGVKTVAINTDQNTQKFINAKQLLGSRVNFVISLKMPFENFSDTVPLPGSNSYKYTLQAAETFLLSYDLAKNIQILVLGNEPMWENGEDAAHYQIFLNAFADTMAVWKQKHNWNFMVFAGALNRVGELKSNSTIISTMHVAKNNPNIDGIDLHVHAVQVSEAESSFKQIRTGFGFTKKMITTEFSMNRLLSDKTTDPLGTWGTQNGYPSTMKMFEYLNHCKSQSYNGTPVSSAEFLSFFHSRPWYPQRWYKTMYDAFKKYGGYAHIGRFYADTTKLLYTETSQMWDLGSVYSSMYRGVDPKTGFQLGSPLVYPEFEPIRNTLYPDFKPNAIIDSKATSNSFSVFPNPVKEVINIKSENKPLSLKAYNTEGMLVAKNKLSSSINTKHLRNGYYMLAIEFKESDIKYVKFLKVE